MACLLRSGTFTVGGMRHLFLRTRWPIGLFTHRITQLHSSPVKQSDFTNFDKLMDQGKRSIQKLKIKDDISKDYQLIYKAPMELTMRVAYPTFLMCVLGLIGALIYRQFNKDSLKRSTNLSRGDAIKVLYPVQELWLFSTGLFLFALAARAIMFKYPFRIYKHCDKKEYIAIYLNPVPPMLKQVQFKSATESKRRNPLYFYLNDCLYDLDCNRKSFLMSHLFRVPKDFTDILRGTK